MRKQKWQVEVTLKSGKSIKSKEVTLDCNIDEIAEASALIDARFALSELFSEIEAKTGLEIYLWTNNVDC